MNLRQHLAESHPGIGLAQPHGMWPEGRPDHDLATAHDMQHACFPEAQTHTHDTDSGEGEQ